MTVFRVLYNKVFGAGDNIAFAESRRQALR